MNEALATPQLRSCDSIACEHCGIYRLCVPLGLGQADLTLLERVVKRKQTFKRGEVLFRAGDRFDFVYAIRSGSAKTSICTDEGHVQVTGFYVAGDLLGLSALASDRYTCEATALETTSVCKLDAAQFQKVASKIPSIQYQMLRIMGNRIRDDEQVMLLLGRRSAEEKLAAYLISLSRRFASRNYSPTRFRLSMSRGDIGNHLGIAEETVCRLLSRFQEEGLITAHRREIRLDDVARLTGLAHACPNDLRQER